MKNIIAFWGRSNTGKTSTIQKLIPLFEKNFPNAKYDWKNDGYDHKVIIEIDGKKIGIESQGDPGGRQEESLKEFIQDEQCDLIICASRTSGKTVDDIVKLAQENKYQITWTTTYQSSSNRDHLNQLCAEHIFQLARSLF